MYKQPSNLETFTLSNNKQEAARRPERRSRTCRRVAIGGRGRGRKRGEEQGDY